MQDPALDRALNECRALLDLWLRFQEFYEGAVKGDNVTPENEKRFLDLKSRIAMLHEVFMEQVDEGRGSAAIAQGMLDNVIRSITLKHVNRLAGADVKKMQIEWHESYLLLNEVVGDLEEKQADFAKITRSQWQMKHLRQGIGRQSANILLNMYFRIAVVVAAIVFVLAGLPMLGVFSYQVLRDVDFLQKPVYFAIDTVIRPYINKDLAWRSLQEAFDFGRRESQIPGDYATMSNVPEPLRRGADSALNWFASSAGVQPGSLQSPLRNAKEYRAEMFAVAGGGFHLTVLYFFMDTVPEANDAVAGLRSWMAELPAGVREEINNKVEVNNQYNLVILFIAEPPNPHITRAYRDDVWQMHKVKR